MSAKMFCMSVCFLIATVCCQAQEPDSKRGDGFFFVAPGGAFLDGEANKTWQFGAGGEATFYHGFGLMADTGYLSSFARRSATFSPGLMYRFNRSNRTQPFVTGGYTVNFSRGNPPDHFLHLGGGFNYWMTPGVAFRTEGRYLTDRAGEYQYVFARLGVAFR